ncbi:MAG: [Fe-Fe] hydrogenase large subunit C-terminal domain-containing protein [Bacteroidales bacterium]|jgi:iron-only hydrogenase group A
MLLTIQVNNKKIKAKKGETILSALNRNGIMIPTLCRMRDFTPTGACRICVVEVEGKERLVTACSHPVEEWMKIWTHSPRVITARKTIVELLLSNHPDDCLYCDRNLHCELQKLSEELNIRERRIRGKKIKQRLDQSSPSVVRELSKCILCGRCVRVCEEIVTSTSLDFINRGALTHVGTAMDRELNFSSCIQCGQCVLVCPTGALHEKHNITEVQEYLNKSEIVKAVQYSPLVAAGIANELGIKYGREFDKVLNAILRKMGFDKVFNTGTGTDIYVNELAEELSDRLKMKNEDPLYIAACPAWTKYAEQFYPELIPSLSLIKSPQQITGVLIKTIVADQLGIAPEQVFSVSVTPCVAMKFESRRDAMMRKGISDVDSVLTVRELARLIKLYGIDITNIDKEPADEPISGWSSLAVLAETSGGLAEGVARLICFKMTGKEPDRQVFKKLRLSGSFRETVVSTPVKDIRIAVVDGLKGLDKLNSVISDGSRFDLVEVMTCPGGCIHGAGLPFITSKDDIRNRARLIYQAVESEAISLPCKSPSMLNLNEKLISSDPETAGRDMFRTHYEKRNVLL